MEDRFAGRAEWFDEHYLSTRGRVRLALVLERLRSMLPPPPAQILDAGGGTGAFAIPLAASGYDVTLLDGSAEWLDRAGRNAEAAGVAIRLVTGSVEEPPASLPTFDAVLCHAVLMYVRDPETALRAVRSMTSAGAALSLLEKNRDALALRPGFGGDYREARRLLSARDSIGRLGVKNRAYGIAEWRAMLDRSGWQVEDWTGVRLFSDGVPDNHDAVAFQALLDLERTAGSLEPYRSVSRLIHFLARAA